MDKLPISVIIIARNAERTIDDCLDSIRRNNPAEIILVDGNSSDKTVEIAGKYTDRIYSDGGRGESYARQLGAEQATLEYVAYVDSDGILAEGALATMLAEFQGSDYISIHAQVTPSVKYLSYWQWAKEQHSHYYRLRQHGQYICMIACLFRRETILKYGFDLSPGGLTDDFGLEYRLKREGHKFGTSSASVYHLDRVDFRSFAWRAFKDGRTSCRYISKYGPWHGGLWHPVIMLYRLGFCLIKAKPKLIPYFVVYGIVGTAGMVKGFFELSGEALRRRSQKDAG